MNQNEQLHHIVIIGGGFGGLYAAKALRKAPVRVTLLDKRNFHLFQPLLYQVATGGLSPGDIASPLRAVLKKSRNTEVLAAEVVDLDAEQKRVILRDGELSYDSLIVATGVCTGYFGHDDWADRAPGLKTVEDALDIRRRILLAFETAEREPDPEKRRAWLTFVIAGGGPTGVELSGAVGQLSRFTLKDEFRRFSPDEAQIFLVEGSERLLHTFPEDLSAKAQKSLEKMGVTVSTSTLVTEIEKGKVTLRDKETGDERVVETRTVLWAAGIKASAMGQVLADRAGAELDRMGRVMVKPDLTVEGFPDIFVIGDLANFPHQTGAPLPGVAQVAMQQGEHAAQIIVDRLDDKVLPPFHYKDKGNLAAIGRNAAVADMGSIRLSGYPAFLVWIFIHILFLVGFGNRLVVLTHFFWSYITHKKGARLITGEDPFPLMEEGEKI